MGSGSGNIDVDLAIRSLLLAPCSQVDASTDAHHTVVLTYLRILKYTR